MRNLVVACSLLAAVTVVAPGSAFAQEKQQTQDGSSPTVTGPGAMKQKTQDGSSPTITGPGALKQN